MTTTVLDVDDSSTNFLIPNGNLILVANYEQVGNDLVLSGPDGTTVIVQGYFDLSSPPDLVSADGTVVSSDIVISIAEAMSSVPEGGLGTPIGQVVLLEGGATATLAGGVVVTLVEGDSVFQDSLIETDEDGVLGLVLSDGTTINLSQNSRLLLDEFVFDPETGLGVSALTILQGVMATRTGEIGKTDPENVSIRALVGTIGIRGTTLVVEVDNVGTVEITLVDGSIVVKMPGGHEYALDDSGEFLVVTPSGSTSVYDGGDERIDKLLEDIQFQESLDKIRAILEEQKSSDGNDANNSGANDGVNGTGGVSVQPQSSSDGSDTPPATVDLSVDDPSGTGGGGSRGHSSFVLGSGPDSNQPTGTINAAPEFALESYTFSIEENAVDDIEGVNVGTIVAEDADADSVLTYSIIGGNDGGLFSIDASTGAITYVGTGEDFEGHEGFELTVQASDGILSTQTTVTVNVADVNEVPTFSDENYSFTLAENEDGSGNAITVGTVSATDPDADNTMRYSIVSGNEDGLFEIDASTGAIAYVGNGEDFEGHEKGFELTVQASDGSLSTQKIVTVQVTDVDEKPEFASDSYAFTLAENADGSAADVVAVGSVSATDPDAGSTVRYSIVSGNDAGLFAIDAETGSITYVGTGEDFEAGDADFTLTVRASDGSLSTEASVMVSVTNVNEVPEFASDSYAFTLAENADGSDDAMAVGRVSATDPDAGSTVRYSIVSGNDAGLFAIDAETGAIAYVGTGENFEGHGDFELTVQASDGTLSTQAVVTVKVTDVNEAPEFASDSYAFALAENVDGSDDDTIAVGTVSATDPDANNTVRYSIVSGNDAGLFAIDAETGAITYVGTGENFEGHDDFELTVRASDGSLSTEVTVTVEVTDVNEAPEFASDSYAFTLAENADGSDDAVAVGAVSATDPDADNTVRYSIVSGNDAGLFAIDTETGAITYVGNGENFEADNADFTLTVQASDGTLSTQAAVTVSVTNVNEAPEFASDNYAFTFPENADGSDHSIPIGRVSATDPDADSTLRYSIVSGSDAELFAINASTGTITYVGTGENFEGRASFTLTVQASDGDLSTRTTVKVNVTDVNEAPKFASDGYSFTLAENADGNGDAIAIGTVSATDPDANNTVRYSIVSGNDANLFEIDDETGAITYVGNGENFEADNADFTLTVQASDGTLSTRTTVTVQVTNVNEAPEFASGSYSFTLPENADGSDHSIPIGRVSATDPDANSTLRYSIVSGNNTGLFKINASTGTITYVGSGENFGNHPGFTLIVRASDGSLSTQATVKVRVTDVNEPPVFSNDNYPFTLAENEDGSSIAVAVGTVSATDPDNDTVTYSIVSGNEEGLFAIDAETGAITYVGTGEDFESDNTAFTLTVRASDGERATQATVTINVTDVDDSNQPPVFSNDNYPFTLAENEDGSSIAVAVGTVSATDPDNNDTVTYSIVSGNEEGLFAIDAETGAITYVGTGEDFESDNTTFTLTVRASDGERATQATVTINVTDVDDSNQPPVFSNDNYVFTLAENEDGSSNAVAVDTVSATDPDNDTVTYSIVSGNEAGLFAIDAETGTITYVGTGENFEGGRGSFTLTVRASDGNTSSQATVTVNVTNVNEAPVLSNDNYVFTLAENEDGSSNAVAVDTVSATDPDNDTVTYSIVSGNEGGLFAIDDATGAITYVGNGENFEADNADFTLTVQASDGSLSSQATVTVNVTNVNEGPVFSSSSYSFNLDGESDGSTNPVSVGSVSATDPESDSITYSISGTNSNLFRISSNGQITYVGSASDSALLPQTLSLTITASDDSIDTEVTVTINVEDDVSGYKPLTNESGDSILSQSEESRIEDSELANQPVEAKNAVSDSAGPGPGESRSIVSMYSMAGGAIDDDESANSASQLDFLSATKNTPNFASFDESSMNESETLAPLPDKGSEIENLERVDQTIGVENVVVSGTDQGSGAGHHPVANSSSDAITSRLENARVDELEIINPLKDPELGVKESEPLRKQPVDLAERMISDGNACLAPGEGYSVVAQPFADVVASEITVEIGT